MPDDTAPAWPDPARDTVEWALAVHFAQNRQPCMSGDPRDRLSSLQRRNMEDARDAVLEALAPLVSTREAAAWAAGAAAMKRDCMDAVPPGHYCHPQDVKDHILALPIPPMPTRGGNADE